MNVIRRRCRHCHQLFLPSIYHPQQVICTAAECQRHRRNLYHRKKLREDPVYGQVCRDSRQKWRANHPGYQRHYRSSHPDYVAKNRLSQKRRDERRRMHHLVKNNLAIDVKRLAAEVWLLGPAAEDLVKNNLAVSQVMIFQADGGGPQTAKSS